LLPFKICLKSWEYFADKSRQQTKLTLHRHIASQEIQSAKTYDQKRVELEKRRLETNGKPAEAYRVRAFQERGLDVLIDRLPIPFASRFELTPREREVLQLLAEGMAAN
jgi:DNA-binding NarL/FixJ family response regulator